MNEIEMAVNSLIPTTLREVMSREFDIELEIDAAVEVTVVHLCQRFIPATSIDWADYKQFAWGDIIYVYFLTVCDKDDTFLQLLLHPKHNHFVQAGKLGCVARFRITKVLMHEESSPKLIFPVCEIVSFDSLRRDSDAQIPISTSWDFSKSKMIVDHIESMQVPGESVVPMHVWYENVTLWPKSEDDDRNRFLTKVAPKSYEGILQETNIEEAYKNFNGGYLENSPMILRVLAKSKPGYYKTRSVTKVFPMKVVLQVGDLTGRCSLVIWDKALRDVDLEQIHSGTVLLLQNYSLRRAYEGFKGVLDKVLPLPNHLVELHVQSNFKCYSYGLTIISNTDDLSLISGYLPAMDSGFRLFDNIE